jgi:hypothetical protein
MSPWNDWLETPIEQLERHLALLNELETMWVTAAFAEWARTL